MATTGFPAILTSNGISPPMPKRACSVTEAASTAATPASMALPPCASTRNPASTSKLLAAATISCVPRTGGNMVGRGWPNVTAAASSAKLSFIPVKRLFNRHAHDFNALQIGAPHAVPLGEQHGVIAGLEGLRAAIGARIVAHDGGSHGICIHGG